MQLIRDGSATYNDVLVRAADNLARARVELGGLNLQTTVRMDDMFGVANADKAARKYAAYSATIRDEIAIPEGASLHPLAPVTMAQLVPTARFNVEAFGLLTEMELVSTTVRLAKGEVKVAVKTKAVHRNLPELAKIVAKNDKAG